MAFIVRIYLASTFISAVESCVNAEYSMTSSAVEESSLITQVFLDLMLDDSEDVT